MDSHADADRNDSSGPDSLEIMSELISLVCVSILSMALGSKTKGERRATLTYGRLLVILLYIMSWAFTAMSIVIVSTNNGNMTSCTLGMVTCHVFYATSKIVIYAWLVERVHLVSGTRSKRLKSRQYHFHIGLLSLYLVILVLMFIYQNIYLLADGKCVIGMRPGSSIPLMIYDFILNLYLTTLFVRPLIKSRHATNHKEWKETRFYKLTRRTVVASLVCLIVSLANVMSVVITKGHLRGLICLTLCTLDVCINVIVVHWTTSATSRMSNTRVAAGTLSQTNGISSDGSSCAEPTALSHAIVTQRHHMVKHQQPHEMTIDMVEESVVGIVGTGTDNTGVVHFGNYNLASSHHSSDHGDDKHDDADSTQSLQSSVRPLQDK